jgi:hypothetical protein
MITLDLLRRRPELVVGPALVVWLLVDCLPIAFGRPFILSVLGTATFEHEPGNVFPITYACAIFLGALALAILKTLNWPRRLLVAFAVPFAFTNIYELPYDLIGYYVWHPYYDWAVWPITLLLNLCWLALGVSTVPFWRLEWKGAVLLAAFLVSLAIWWLLFLPYIPPIVPFKNPEGSGYIVSKVILAVVLAVLLWEGRPGRSPQEAKAPASAPLKLPTDGPMAEAKV